ncbi:MAG: radical SAM protein [Anaerolineales bacterium]|nr:radical SAM protein [Anaerolineales bacterium]
MDVLEQLSLTNINASLEAGSLREKPACYRGRPTDLPITEAVMPNGQTIILLKTMVTSACERNCYYCPFRAGRDFKRTTFTPDDLALTYMKLYHARAVEGLFLSSGLIGGGVKIQDKIIATAELLRRRYAYQGYIHAKIMPGAEKDQILRLMELADRVSLNLEAPNTKRLKDLAPKKIFMDELVQRLLWVDEIRKNRSPFKAWRGRWPSSATQFVVGAVGETDHELIATSEKMFQMANLRRVYYSRFTPQQDTPLENHSAENPWRQHRLYQSSFLLRDYGFQMEELPFDPSGNLPIHTDPKLAWAQAALSHQPIELNKAGRKELLRVPGIGPKGADSIITARRQCALTQLNQLKSLHVNAKRAAPFILLNGKRPEFQLGLI